MTSNEIRVLHILGTLNRDGAETMIMNIYRNIDRTKIQFDFLIATQQRCDYEDEVESLGGRVYRVSYGLANIFKRGAQFKNILVSGKYRAIHIHTASATLTNIIYMTIARFVGVLNIIIHSHNTSCKSYIKHKLLYKFQSYLSRYHFACSSLAAKWLFGKRFVEKKKIIIIKNGIDARKFKFNNTIRNEIRNELNIEGKYVIGHVGRFSYQKNHEFIIDIFYEIYRRNKDSVLLLVGKGELQEHIKEKVKKLDIEANVRFLGVRNDVDKLLQAFDIFLFPSYHEGFPVCIVEAQASGLRCLLSDAITREAEITSLLEYLSLNLNAKQWAERAISKLDNERSCFYKDIMKAGFDSFEVANNLQEFYIELDHR